MLSISGLPLITDGVFTAINDPHRSKVAPKTETVPPALNFAPLENAAVALSMTAQRYKKGQDSAAGRGLAFGNSFVRYAISKRFRMARLYVPAGSLISVVLPILCS